MKKNKEKRKNREKNERKKNSSVAPGMFLEGSYKTDNS